MARVDPQMKLRMPAELKAQIEMSAASHGRSLNAEIVLRLQISLHENPTIHGKAAVAEPNTELDKFLQTRSRCIQLIDLLRDRLAKLEADQADHGTAEFRNQIIIETQKSLDRWTSELLEIERWILQLTTQGRLL